MNSLIFGGGIRLAGVDTIYRLLSSGLSSKLDLLIKNFVFILIQKYYNVHLEIFVKPEPQEHEQCCSTKQGDISVFLVANRLLQLELYTFNISLLATEKA